MIYKSLDFEDLIFVESQVFMLFLQLDVFLKMTLLSCKFTQQSVKEVFSLIPVINQLVYSTQRAFDFPYFSESNSNN